ncbi:MAG: response regulator [Hyphomicrobiales bacterium]|jgi:two-component system, OmpR family, phosphate regulon response regulator OmpR|nr:response regulator [Hyphomicrobiales bacterium]
MARTPREPLADEAPHILVIDDDRRLRELLARFLTDNGFRVTAAANASVADGHLQHLTFDALVLDVMMPGESGFDFARRLRQSSGVPILMLTARANSQDRITGLELGVDDYLTKPFEPRELVLRLTNVLKRNQRSATANEAAKRPEFVKFGSFIYWLDRGELRKGDETIRLTERERDILSILSARQGEPVSRDELSGGEEGPANERTVDVQINRLRRKIERDPADPLLLQTVRSVGYRLVIDRI